MKRTLCWWLLFVGGLTARGQTLAPVRPDRAEALSQPAFALPAQGGDVFGVAVAEPTGSAEAGRFWARGDYLLWWIEGMSLPPLLSGSPAGTPLVGAGVLGTPGTTILFGNSRVNNDERSGGRFRLGGWLDDDRTFGIESSFLILEGQGGGFVAGSASGSQIVSRPFVNALTGGADAELVSFPGIVGGTGTVDFGSTNFLGADVLLRRRLWRGDNAHLDVLGGYRFLRFDEGVRVTENLQALPAPFVPGTQILVQDSFGVNNEYHAGVLGLSGRFNRGPWSLDVETRVGFGEVCREVEISGLTSITVPGAAPALSTGGLLAQVSNIGTFRSDDFAVVPEVDVNVGYRLTDGLRLSVGYSLIYWTRVARAGEQIDLTINRNLIPPTTGPAAGPSRPAFAGQRNEMWVQGLALGLEWRY